MRRPVSGAMDPAGGAHATADAAHAYEHHAHAFLAGRDASGIGARVIRDWCAMLPPGATLIELACGGGYPVTRVLREAGLGVWAVDSSPTLLATFAQRFPEIPVQCAKVQESDFFGRRFDAALAVFRSGDFAGAQAAFLDFAKRYPKSGYYPSALFWLGNAQYATTHYKEAITNFRLMLNLAPDHARAPEALLSIANCQIELKDPRAARKTLEDLIRLHPQSEAAQAAKERLAKLR